ncbi:MAG TPA: hypothetical protein PLO51_03280 [Candidatus Micrarchaeota archaeon]|nr:hypothetical protein [Candidatus Micrarchaeota archaeon]
MAEILIPNKQDKCLRDNKAARESGSLKVFCKNFENCPGKVGNNGSTLCLMPMVESMFSVKMPAALEQAYAKACKQP